MAAKCEGRAAPRSLDPRKSLRIVTWNCGSVKTQTKAILNILVTQQPNILALQEAKDSCGSVSSLRAQCRTLGYILSHNKGDDLVTIWLRGLACMPLKPLESDAPFRMQRFAISVADQRLLLRHVHAPSADGHPRKYLLKYLDGEPYGALLLDVGDWNCRPVSQTGLVNIFPNVHTFRNSSLDDDGWVSCIDGFRTTSLMAPYANATPLPVVKAQHRPILLALNTNFQSWDLLRWKPCASPPRLRGRLISDR